MKKRNIIIIIAILIVITININIYLNNREYKYICFNTEITKGTLIIEDYLEECTTNKKLPEGVIVNKNELLTDEYTKSYQQTKAMYKQGEILYKSDFILYEYPKSTSSDIELLNEVEVINHGNSSEELTRYKAYIKKEKLYAINLTTNEEKLIFDTEKVKGIAIRPFCCAGNGNLLILTNTGNVYFSEKDCIYSFDFDFPFQKLDTQNIVAFELVPRSDYDSVKALYGINISGEEFLIVEPHD